MHRHAAALPKATGAGGAPRRPVTVSARVLQEIAQVKWMPLAEYADAEFIRTQPTMKISVACMQAYQRGMYKGMTAEELRGTRGGLHLLVHGLHAADLLPEGWENT